MDKITLGVITNAYTKAKKDLNVLGKNVVNLDEKTRNKLSKAVRRALNTVRSVTTKNGKELSTNEITKNVNNLARIYGLPPIKQPKHPFNKDIRIKNKINEIEREREKIKAKIRRRGLLDPQQGFTDEESLGIESMSIQDQQSIMDSLGKGIGVNEYGGVSKDTFSDVQSITSQDQYGFETVTTEGADPGSDASSEMGEATNKGSLITKRKASGKVKPKYMKRGGLASKK